MNGYQYRVVATGLASPDATSNAATLTVNPATPTLSSVSPNSGLPAGGNTVTLSGSNFTGVTAVSIGGLSATGIVVNSDTTITAVAPAHAIGAVNVVVTTPGGTATLTNGYTYTVPFMSFAPLPGALNGGTVGIAYSRTVTASGGVAPYEYVVTSGSLPDGLTLDASTGTISGTPTTAGDASFTLQVTGADHATLTANFSIAIAEVAPIAGNVSAIVAANSTASTITLTLSGGATTSVAIASGASHGTATASGTSITYMPTAGYSGTDSFTYTATNSAGTSAPATVTISVTAPALGLSPAAGALSGGTTGVVYAGAMIAASGGTSPYCYEVTSGSLPDGLTLDASTGAISGTPTTAVNATFTITATDANSATGSAGYTLAVTSGQPTVQDQTIVVGDGTAPQDVRLDAGATGGPFDAAELVSVEPANGGRAEITWGDYAAGGPVAPVGWYLKFSPNPAYSGQVRVRFRLTNAVGSSGTGTVTYSLGHDAAKVAQDIDALVHGFVQTRQSMIASTLEVPGLMERRRMGQATDPVTTRMSPSADGLTLGFATSLAQMQAAGGAASSPFNAWVDGALLAHNREENGGKWGSFAMVSLGADYLVSEKALLGLSVHYDRMTDPTDEDAKLTGNGWMAGPYASFEIGSNVFWDTSLLYGGSSNDIDTPFWDGTFDTERWLFDSSIKGQWQLDDITVLTPRLRAAYFAEKVEDYAVRNDAGDEIGLGGFAQEQLRVSLGAEIARSFLLQGGATLTPKLGATAGVSGLDGSGLFGSVSTGLSLQAVNGWAFDADLLFNLEGEGEKSLGAKVGVSTRF